MGSARRRGAGRSVRRAKRKGSAKSARHADARASPVRRWIAEVKPEHRAIVRKIDGLIRRTVPGVHAELKWRQVFYGVEGKGWIVAVNSYKDYVSLTFFGGTSLRPVPPLGEHQRGRRANIHDMSEYDDGRLRSWFQQAAVTKGWGTVNPPAARRP